MRRHSIYICTALVTFTIGLACSLLLGTNDGLFLTRIKQFSHAPTISIEEAPRIVGGMAGQGVSDEGYPTSFSNHDYSDGTYVHQLSIFYPSAQRANSEVQKRIQNASGVVRREAVLDEDGKQIGERVVITFSPYSGSSASSAELLWTEHGRFVIQKRRSLQDILTVLDHKR